jgi:RNase H-like domain found in reverse transcriptase
MLEQAPVKGSSRQRYTTNKRLGNSSDEEKLSFAQTQQALSTPSYLIYQNVYRDLYIDVDASKKGIGVFVFHVKEGTTLKLGEWPERSKCQPILFLSRLLNKAEQNYRPTEMEIAGTVWAVRKLKHMVESSTTPPTKIFTDHGAITGIIRQRSMQTESTDQSNLRLIRASMLSNSTSTVTTSVTQRTLSLMRSLVLTLTQQRLSLKSWTSTQSLLTTTQHPSLK